MDLHTGKQEMFTNDEKDPDGFDITNFNHVYSVVVDSIDKNSKEIWLPCRFTQSDVNSEISIR